MFCISLLRAMSYSIKKENLLSDSLTKDVLTVYAEGLACNNFDRKKFCNGRRHDKDTWYILKKSVGEEDEPNSIDGCC